MPASNWQTAFGASAPENTDSFTITAPPKTDIWRRADDDDVFNAPIIYQKMSASDFKKIEVTVWAPWRTQYDQGGLVIAFPNSASSSSTPEDANAEVAAFKNMKWIKAGIEFFGTEPVLGIVGTDRYSDWSLSPMKGEQHQKARFRAERDGTTLWVYAAQEGDEKLRPMREVKWAFQGGEEAEVLVGVYAAKPTPESGSEEEGVTQQGIEVTFSELIIEKDE